MKPRMHFTLDVHSRALPLGNTYLRAVAFLLFAAFGGEKRKRSEDTSRSAKGLPPLGTLLLSDLATALTPILTRIDISLHLCYSCIDATIITVQMLWRNTLSVTTITVKCWPKT